MGNIWKEILSSLILGLLIPQLMLNMVDRPAPPEATVPTVTETQASGSESMTYLPVLVEKNCIKIMELEEYVLGVVLAEMPATFEPEALKAQAVVARTYALRRLQQGDRHSDVAICGDSTCCQAYITADAYLQERGTQKDLDKVAAAVAATRGLVLTYEGQLIEATYFSCSGGRTEDAVAVWGTEIPYLQAVDSPGEEQADIYENQVYFKASDFAAALGRNLTGTPESWLGMRTYTEGGGVASMVIGGISYTGVELRGILGLNSTAFTMTADSNGITIKTQGRGHRVGMSQYGADAMGAAGCSYEQILLYYYQGTRIDKLEQLG